MIRAHSTRASEINADHEPIPENYTLDSIKPPKHWAEPDDVEEDPMAYKRKPVSSAHTIDLTASPPQVSTLDSAAISPDGEIIHGRYGNLGSNPNVPLEYISLLHPAACAAAALRSMESGTVLVYGAGEPTGLAACQLATSPVVAVVAGHQSGQDEFVDEVKSMVDEPSVVVPEELVLIRSEFKELVQAVENGEDVDDMDPDAFVDEFKKNLLEYSAFYPDSQMAVDPESYRFKGKEKDRKNFQENMTAYLEQFPQGAPAIDQVILNESFTKEQYAIFKSKFHKQTASLITGDPEAKNEFNPGKIVKSMVESPEIISDYLKNQTNQTDATNTDFVPYEFSTLKDQVDNGLETLKGGSIAGAIIAVTPDLKVAAEAVAKGKTLREKAEALQFLTESEKQAFAAANGIASLAKQAGKSVVVIGGTLPGFESVEPSAADVKEALSAMEINEDGSARLNYFVQVYRASDYPVYADFAIHRATETLAGPRQIVVTK